MDTLSKQKAWFEWRNWRMMIVASFGLVLAFLIMGLSFMVTASPETETVASMEAKKVEYYLPYPGILPDSPLYKLKVIRDRLKLILTLDEGDKAKLELQLSDKRMNASYALFTGNKNELAVTTATKAEKYLEQSVNRVIKLIKLGRDEKSQLLALDNAIAKHGELLLIIGQNGKLEDSIKTNQLLSQRVKQILLEEK